MVKCGGKIKHGGMVFRLGGDFILVIKLGSYERRCSIYRGFIVVLMVWYGFGKYRKNPLLKF